MSHPVTFGNPVRDTLATLRAGLPAQLGAPPASSISAREWAPEMPRPHVAVASTGRSRDSRLNGTADVRLLVWHEDGGEGEDLAASIEAILLAHPGTATTRGYTPALGPLATYDVDTGQPMASLTVTARLRPLNF